MLETMEKPAQTYDTLPERIIDCEEIKTLIPHRYPFLLVDRVTHLDPGKAIRGYKNVSNNEPFFQGHFPGKPIMPGVLIVEAMAQIGCIMVSLMPAGQNKLLVFAGIDDVRFRRPVVPGDRLDLDATLLKIKGPIGKAEGRATVNGELVMSGTIMFSLLPREVEF